MVLKSLKLENFRNYSQKGFEFEGEVTVVVGKNGTGKTNLLEAIELLSSGESWRADKVDEMVKIGEEYARINAECSNEFLELELMLTRGKLQGKRVNKRIYRVNGNGRGKNSFVGQLMTVLFQPDDLQIVIGGAEKRRAWLDGVLIKSDKEYRHSWVSYREGLKRRNKLLDQIREGKTKIETLEFWDRLILKHGEVIQVKREDFLRWVNEYFKEQNWIMGLEYERSLLTMEKLEERREREIAAGFTLGGPHRDEITMRVKKKMNLASYGSRGQQRLGVIRLKMAELKYLEKKRKQSVVLLLDDVFSELDEENDRLVMEMVSGCQTILTATKFKGEDFKKPFQRIELES